MNDKLIETDSLARLFLEDVPMLDVRAPIEFAKGALPNAINIPLLYDNERKMVGICYKNNGQDDAVKLGNELVSGDKKQARIELWHKFVKDNPDGVLYCFRGGMRSKITQSWLHEATGIEYPRVSGGYKNMRQFLLDKTDSVLKNSTAIVLGGRTGSDKTQIINKTACGIDLEGLANHRGSAFGNRVTPQPSPVDFENALAIKLIKHSASSCKIILLEDEGRNIGKVTLPSNLKAKLDTADIIIVNVPQEQRIEAILQHYVIKMNQEFVDISSKETGFENFSNYLFASLEKIQKRLGGDRHKQAKNLMQQALTAQQNNNEYAKHRIWIEFILKEYYDPMYDYQISAKQTRIKFSGNTGEVTEYIKDIA